MALRIAVVGCGGIGLRHARNLRALGVAPAALCDTDPERLETAGREFGVNRLFATARDLIQNGPSLDAAVVCVPTVSHVETGTALARAGAAILMEKPLGVSTAGLDELSEAVAGSAKAFMMAMCYRYHPGLRILREMIQKRANGRVFSALQWGGSYLPDWRPGRDYRSVYSAKTSLGGGVLWDSIHGLDTARWLFGEVEEVSCVLARLGALEIDAEDVAAMILKHASGALSELHADYLQRGRRQFVEVVCEEGNLFWDFSEPRARRYRASTGGWEDASFSFELNDMYLAEMKDFLDCVRGKIPSPVGLEDGIKTVRLALAAIESSRAGRAARPSPAPAASA